MSHRVPPKRKTKREKIAESEVLRKQQKRTHTLLIGVFCSLFFLGLVANVLTNLLYRTTIIDWKVPLIIWLFSGCVVTPFAKPYWEKAGTQSVFLQLICNVTSIGGILAWLFMAVNSWSSAVEREVVVPVIQTGSLARGRYGTCEAPYAVIRVDKTDKQLVFACGVRVEGHQWVQLTVQNGLLGFMVIRRKTIH